MEFIRERYVSGIVIRFFEYVSEWSVRILKFAETEVIGGVERQSQRMFADSCVRMPSVIDRRLRPTDPLAFSSKQVEFRGSLFGDLWWVTQRVEMPRNVLHTHKCLQTSRGC